MIPASEPSPEIAALISPFPAVVTSIPCFTISARIECRHAAGHACSKTTARPYCPAVRTRDRPSQLNPQPTYAAVAIRQPFSKALRFPERFMKGSTSLPALSEDNNCEIVLK